MKNETKINTIFLLICCTNNSRLRDVDKNDKTIANDRMECSDDMLNFSDIDLYDFESIESQKPHLCSSNSIDLASYFSLFEANLSYNDCNSQIGSNANTIEIVTDNLNSHPLQKKINYKLVPITYAQASATTSFTNAIDSVQPSFFKVCTQESEISKNKETPGEEKEKDNNNWTFTPINDYLPHSSNCFNNSNDVSFFDSAITLLKNIIYYRFNIAKFFNILHREISKKQKIETMVSDMHISVLEGFITHAMTFAESICNNVDDFVLIADENQMQLLKKYESYVINEWSNGTKLNELKYSNEYYAIIQYNKKYFVALNNLIRKTSSRPLFDFLFPIFTSNNPISKYYNMLVSVLLSLYDTNLIINKKLSQSLQNHILDLNFFQVHACRCSQELKQNFFIHWVICWIFCFSNFFCLPVYSNSKNDIWFVIGKYPREFFVQLILLAHIFVNFNGNISETDLKRSEFVDLRANIKQLLFVNVEKDNKSLFERTLHDMFINISNIFSYKIYTNHSRFCIRIVRTPKENIEISNQLIPTLQNLVTIIFNLTKESYRLTKNKKRTSS